MRARFHGQVVGDVERVAQVRAAPGEMDRMLAGPERREHQVKAFINVRRINRRRYAENIVRRNREAEYR
jgi:hypothetical protein